MSVLESSAGQNKIESVKLLLLRTQHSQTDTLYRFILDWVLAISIILMIITKRQSCSSLVPWTECPYILQKNLKVINKIIKEA